MLSNHALHPLVPRSECLILHEVHPPLQVRVAMPLCLLPLGHQVKSLPVEPQVLSEPPKPLLSLGVALGVPRQDGLDLHTVLVSLDCLIDYLRDVGARKIQVEGLPDGSEVFQLLLVAPNLLLAVSTFQLSQDYLAASENVLLALVSFNGLLLWLYSYWVPVWLHVLIKGRSQILLETIS
jgi:hypothetical protein